MYVNDLEATRDFFIKYLNAVPGEMYHNPRTGLKTYFLSFGNECRLEIMSRPEINDGDKDIYRCGYNHIAFSLGSKEQVDRLTAKLKTDGFEIISGPRTTGDGYYESCFKDAEGNLIELSE